MPTIPSTVISFPTDQEIGEGGGGRLVRARSASLRVGGPVNSKPNMILHTGKKSHPRPLSGSTATSSGRARIVLGSCHLSNACQFPAALSVSRGEPDGASAGQNTFLCSRLEPQAAVRNNKAREWTSECPAEASPVKLRVD